jgi:hypothetical protein
VSDVNSYHPALVELLRAAEAGELDRRDLEVIAEAARKRHDARGIVDGVGDFVGVLERPPTQGFFRALRKAMS